MAEQMMPGRFGPDYRALGFLRLLFASLVIVAHTPDLMDGNADRDLLIRAVGGRLTSGGVAVGGFFIISGFLITASYLSRQDAKLFMQRRIARIYPAFGVMFLICLLIVRPIAGGAGDSLSLHSLIHELVALVTLNSPNANGAFIGLPHPSLNGAIWTLPDEFGCYLMVLGLGNSGLLGRVRVIMAIAIACLLLNDLGAQAESNPQLQNGVIAVLYALREPFRLIGLFFAGAMFFLVQRKIQLRLELVAGAIAGLISCLFIPLLINIGIAVFGTYLIFRIRPVRREAGIQEDKRQDRHIVRTLYLRLAHRADPAEDVWRLIAAPSRNSDVVLVGGHGLAQLDFR